MSKELYKKIKKNIEESIEPILENLDDSYLFENKDRIVEKFIQEICDETKSKKSVCTEKEIEAYRKLIGIDNNGQKLTYKEVSHELKKKNIKSLVFNANRKLIWSIYREILFEDKLKLIQQSFEYKEDKGMILPEDIEIENLKSIIYFEYEKLQEIGIYNVKDLINYTIPEISRIINKIILDSKRKSNKAKVSNELIEAIHNLGFLFNGESGYEEQLNFFDIIKKEMNQETNNANQNNNNIIDYFNYRKELIFSYNRLIKEKKQSLRPHQEINNDIYIIKEKIIKLEEQIKNEWNNKHR